MDRYDQSKILEKNENLRGEISSKDLIVKMLSESFSQTTNSFNKPNSIRSRGKNFVDKSLNCFIQPKKIVKQVIIMV